MVRLSSARLDLAPLVVHRHPDHLPVLERLEQAYRSRSPWLFGVKGFPSFYSIEGLAADPRFQDLCRRVLPTRGAS